jgi:hypothetical protein
MSATTVIGQVRSDQATTHSKRNAVIALIAIGLFALSFFVGRATATSHVNSSAQVATHTQLSPADRAIVANDVAPLSQAITKLSPADRAIVANDVAPVSEAVTKLSPADRAIVANDVAPVTPTYVEVAPNGEQISPANRAQIANDVAPVTQQFSQANTASCIAGRPC